jgi:hypothetical protein
MHTYLYRSREGLPPLNRLTDLEREELIEPIDSSEVIIRRLDELFPELRWEQIAGVWSGAHANCRIPYLDILLSDDSSGLCKFIVLNKPDASTVRMVMQTFNLNYACTPENGKFVATNVDR